MSSPFPPSPVVGELLETASLPGTAADFLALRRSAGKEMLGEPGPDGAMLAEILRVAARVPDHRRVEPWRFIRFTVEARAAFGARLQAIARRRDELSLEDQSRASGLLLRAPVVIAVISSPDRGHKTPVWEQELSAGAVCYNLLLAARAAGFGAVWLTEWISYDGEVDALLGLSQTERVAGFIYIGTPSALVPERPRPDLSAKVEDWKG